jgi:hypothetical protein
MMDLHGDVSFRAKFVILARNLLEQRDRERRRT